MLLNKKIVFASGLFCFISVQRTNELNRFKRHKPLLNILQARKTKSLHMLDLTQLAIKACGRVIFCHVWAFDHVMCTKNRSGHSNNHRQTSLVGLWQVLFWSQETLSSEFISCCQLQNSFSEILHLRSNKKKRWRK